MVGAKQKSELGGRGEAGERGKAILNVLNLFLMHFIIELASSCSKGEGEEAGGGAAGEAGQAGGGAEEAQVTSLPFSPEPAP